MLPRDFSWNITFLQRILAYWFLISFIKCHTKMKNIRPTVVIRSFKEVNIYYSILLKLIAGWHLTILLKPLDIYNAQHNTGKIWFTVKILQDLICCKATQEDCLPLGWFFPFLWKVGEEVGGQTSQVVCMQYFLRKYKKWNASVCCMFFSHIIVWLGSGSPFSHLNFRTRCLKGFSKQEIKKKMSWIALENLQLVGFKMFP